VSARAEIEGFFAELAGARMSRGDIEFVAGWIAEDEDPDAVEYCDRICTVIRRDDLSLKERFARLRPVLAALIKVLERS
jgi:hypothetical protein